MRRRPDSPCTVQQRDLFAPFLLSVGALIAVLGACRDARSAPATSQTPSATPSGSGLGAVLESLNGTWEDASKSVQENVGPQVEALQNRTKEEMRKLSQWQYKVVEFPAGAKAAELEEELNKLGAEGWDCASLLPNGERLRATCKRRPGSAFDYLKYVPGL